MFVTIVVTALPKISTNVQRSSACLHLYGQNKSRNAERCPPCLRQPAKSAAAHTACGPAHKVKSKWRRYEVEAMGVFARGSFVVGRFGLRAGKCAESGCLCGVLLRAGKPGSDWRGQLPSPRWKRFGGLQHQELAWWRCGFRRLHQWKHSEHAHERDVFDVSFWAACFVPPLFEDHAVRTGALRRGARQCR